MSNIAFFISPHGFGHAARACALFESLTAQRPGLAAHLWTRVPEWFFASSLSARFTYHELQSDIGLVQTTPLHEDLGATVACLAAFLPFDSNLVRALAGELRATECRLVLCDIAPLGIAVARAAGIPSILIENFTWDWIYQGYVAREPRLEPFISYLADVFSRADHHLQTEPLCRPLPGTYKTAPISRAPRTPRPIVRAQLGIPSHAPAVLITMGGIATTSDRFLPSHGDEVYYVIPGGSARMERDDHVVRLPHHSAFFHPDLIHACDAVIGKLGYSTVAEAYAAGVPIGYVARPEFGESPVIAAFVARAMQGMEIPASDWERGTWQAHVPALLRLPRLARARSDGAAQAADYVARWLS